MATAPVGSSTLDAYREEADRFLAALDEEIYLHFAGLKDDFEVARIYEQFSDLTTLDACDRLHRAVQADGAAATDLWRFACEGYLGDITRDLTEELARLEATLDVYVDGDEIPFRMLRPAIANEPERARREHLDSVRVELTEEHLNAHHVRLAELRREGTGRLGFGTYRELYDGFRFPLEQLRRQCERFLDLTEDLFIETADRLFRRRLGIPLGEAGRWDVPRLFRAADWDDGFPADAMVPALVGTLGDLGIDLEAQENVHLDIERRPKKSARAFCTPIEIPDRIMLVIQPIGGPEDWHALFHEAGHTEHYAHVSPDLPLEARRLGDNAITEGWAALFEFMVNDPAWLSRRLDFGRPDAFADEAATVHLYLSRRYAAKFLYELELYDNSELEAMHGRYVELMREATKIEPSAADFLADVDPGFYSSSYLRSWAFEAQMEAFLREEYGRAWFARREAGSLLCELWSEGQRVSADELLDDVTGAELDLEAVGERARERLG